MEPETPWLHERWCWEGDETPLPRKWATLVGGDTECQDADKAWLQSNVITSTYFDPQSFFFLTSRYVVM